MAPTGGIAGTNGNGIFIPIIPTRDPPPAWVQYIPPGPHSNTFSGLAVDDNGVLWAGTGSGNGQGFLSFDGTRWRAYRQQEYPELPTNNYYKVSIGANNAKWVSSWGGGVALLDGPGNIRRVFTHANGLPSTLTNDPNFIVVGGVATDRSGTAWLTTRTPPNDTSLTLFRTDSTLGYVTGQPTRLSTSSFLIFNDLVIDQFGTKFFANFNRFESQTAQGLFYYNEGGPLPGHSSAWGQITTQNGLTSNQVWCVALGRDGELWVGSDQGISIIFNTQFPRSVALYHPLRDQVVQAIATDPLNNKWVATKRGVFVLSSDGTQILNHYTAENTSGRLLDDDVTSIAIDGRSGTVYFSTEKGLSSIATPGVTPVRSFESLKATPNPFYLPATEQLIIDGLVQGTTLKITTVSGAIVREIHTPGGRVGYWDGRNEAGELVASGIYVIVAASEDGSSVATGKVAVLRK